MYCTKAVLFAVKIMRIDIAFGCIRYVLYGGIQLYCMERACRLHNSVIKCLHKVSLLLHDTL